MQIAGVLITTGDIIASIGVSVKQILFFFSKFLLCISAQKKEGKGGTLFLAKTLPMGYHSKK